MAIKVAFIGAGSVGFTRKLFRDILAVPELQDTHFALTDISERNLDMVAQLCLKDIGVNELAATVSTTTDRREALTDADYVINCTRIGGLEAFALDVEIPLKYGIDQCVGDTICAGGIMYGQRNIPQVLAFCEDTMEVAKPGALFLNYSNPMAMNTWAALDRDANIVGLCHGVQNTTRQIAEVLDAEPERLYVSAAGINHQTWFIEILEDGTQVTAEELLEAYERHPEYSKTEKVRIDVLRRFGYYSTESNGHLSEYLPWYRKRPDEIERWVDMSHWSDGETAGYLRVCTERRNWFETDYPVWLEVDDPPIGPEVRSSEHASWIIEAMETGRTYRGHFNVRNDGAIANLPADCVVEVPGYVDGGGISIPSVGELPLACAATCSASISAQRMAKEAAVHGDVMLLKQAMLHDPLTAAVCSPEEVWQMTDEMLVAQARWLPQYADEIPGAKRRLAEAEPLGTKSVEGAARLKARPIEELRAATTSEHGIPRMG
jgi:alpha-galactosidase